VAAGIDGDEKEPVMPVLESPRTAPARPPCAATRRVVLALDAGAASDVTMRVLGLLRRRGCEIAAVEYRRADRHRPAHFAVTYEPPARVGHRIEAWLRGLVDVIDVREA
jgi:acetolactate synthase small subunit